jgi:dTDP-4-dehydrorhamnose 3,5-epimerase-like enzyme
LTEDKTTVNDVTFLDIPKIIDPRGNLAVIEQQTIPFSHKRVYYLFDVPEGARRGGHSHIEQSEVLIALNGSFTVIVDDGNEKKSITLDNPLKGLHIPNGIWRELEEFKQGSVCLVLASDIFEEADYIREYADFKSSKG